MRKGFCHMKTFLTGLAALGLSIGLATAATAAEEEGGTPHYPLKKPAELNWSFEGPFGTYDKGQLQRGFKVYREVCSACHSLNLVAFRTLEELGYSEAQVRAIAAEYEVEDGPDENGDMFMRPAKPSDYFPSSFANEQQAAAANNGAVPPDFSLIAKARAVERGFPTFLIDIFTQYAEGGVDYIHALLMGYEEEAPEGVLVPEGTYYNPYFVSGPALAMAPPLADGMVTYDDGAPETLDQYSRDISAFLMWAAEPHMDARKETGFTVMIFLIIFAGLVYLTKRKVWSDMH